MSNLEIETHIVYIEWKFSLLVNKLANFLKYGSNKCCIKEDTQIVSNYIGVVSRWYNDLADEEERCLTKKEVEKIIFDAIRILKKY